MFNTMRSDTGADREAETLDYLKKFQKKLSETRSKESDDSVADEQPEDRTWSDFNRRYDSCHLNIKLCFFFQKFL